MAVQKKPRIVVVMPAYNAAHTIKKTVEELPEEFASNTIVVDDHSTDETVRVATSLGLTVFQHPKNTGYGGNQKTCYQEALKLRPDVVVMLHPDYQYDASLLPELVRPILQGRFDFMFGNRIHSRRGAIDGGMPISKYLFNRLFTAIANPLLGLNLPEYLSGLRAYSSKVLQRVPFQRFSNDFAFDQQFTCSAISFGYRIGSIPIPTRYYHDSSSIRWKAGLIFGIESVWTLTSLYLHERGVVTNPLFNPSRIAVGL